jgi:hypothetical protein
VKLRELIHEATHHFTYLDEPVYVWAYNAGGEYVRFEVTDLTVDCPGGKPRQVLDIRERADRKP